MPFLARRVRWIAGLLLRDPISPRESLGDSAGDTTCSRPHFGRAMSAAPMKRPPVLRIPDCVGCVVLPRLSHLLNRWMYLELSSMCPCTLHPPVLGPPKVMHDPRCSTVRGVGRKSISGPSSDRPTFNWLGTPNLQSRYRGHVAKHEAYCNWVPLGKMLSRPGAAPAAGWLPPPQSCASHGNR